MDINQIEHSLEATWKLPVFGNVSLRVVSNYNKEDPRFIIRGSALNGQVEGNFDVLSYKHEINARTALVHAGPRQVFATAKLRLCKDGFPEGVEVPKEFQPS